MATPTYIPTDSAGGYSDHFESAKKHNKKADRQSRFLKKYLIQKKTRQEEERSKHVPEDKEKTNNKIGWTYF